MDEQTKIILEFIKKMGRERQKKLLQLKQIKIGKRQLSDEEKLCRTSIKHIEAKIRSEVLASPSLKQRFNVADNQEEGEDTGDREF